MKRVGTTPSGVWLPSSPIVAGSDRHAFAATVVELQTGTEVPSACLGCPDEPCVRFTPDEVAREARVVTPYVPDLSVCPTGAIQRDGTGLANIARDACIGCGLCIVRCPVGAIALNAEGWAQVAPPSEQVYQHHETPPQDFINQRADISSVLSVESAPFPDAQLVIRQVARAEISLNGLNAQRVLRLLARNAFLLSGVAARLKNPGDNNAFSELVVDDGGLLLVSEIEPSGDVLDALRRSLSGCAIAISRYGVSKPDVGAAVFVHRLPNERVDFYGVVRDIRTRLGIPTYTIPITVLLLAIRAHGAGIAHFVRECCLVDDQNITLAPAVSAHFGDLLEPGFLGIAPSK